MTIRGLGQVFLVKLHLWILLAALFGLADVVLFLILEYYFPAQLLVLVAAFVCPAGLVTTLASAMAALREIRAGDGELPSRAYRRMATSVVAAFLFGIPGFVTAGLALLVLLPGVRSIVGTAVLRPFQKQLVEGYEYIRSDDE